MNNLILTVIDKRVDLEIALLEHIRISLMSLLIAIFIAVPLAIVISKYKKISEFILQIAGIMQTIPSLALLGLFIPIVGIGIVPSIIALVIYAIFPILQNTITSLNEIDPNLEEAAEAFGMTKIEKLRKFELELAMPVIISGIRTSAVMVIGTATLAALVGAGGLGSFILLGIDRHNTSLILIGAILSALLAVLFNFSIKLLEKVKIKNILLILGATIIALVISIIPMKMQGESIVIASKLGAEPEIILNMYKEVIEAKTDIKVDIKPNFGKTVFLYEALKNGDIDIYTEYTGTVMGTLLKKDVNTTDPNEVYELARDLIYEQDKLVLLKPMKFQNTYAIATTKEFAEKYDLKKISDLGRITKNVVAGFTLEFNDRKDGNEGLKSIYGINLQVKTMEPSLRYTAILNGDVNIMDSYSTDSELRRYNMVLLEDDKNMFPPYQAAPLIREDIIKKHPELKECLELLAGIITEEEMIQMNYEVDVNGKSANEVAKEFLKKMGIL